MKYAIKLSLAVCTGALLVSCAGNERPNSGGGIGVSPGGAALPGPAVVSDFPQKIGAPYQVDGTTYTPEDVAEYDDVGDASFYGAEFAGRPTANGEKFNPDAISGAHKTLPLPSYVEVTALDTGRTILVRINDRGPFANDRVIDLSKAAAQQLGILGQGVAGVRVRKVNPPEQERAVLRGGLKAAERLDTPESLLKILRGKLAALRKAPAATPAEAGDIAANITAAEADAAPEQPAVAAVAAAAAKPASSGRSDSSGVIRKDTGARAARDSAAAAGSKPAATGKSYIVQIASFSSRARADTLARQIGAAVKASGDGRHYRVRYGPFAGDTDAQTALAKARQRGYPQAKIFRE